MYRFIAVLSLVVGLSTNLALAAQATPDMQSTSSGGIELRVFSELSPVALNRIHSWKLQLMRQNGAPLSGASVTVSGGMPEHDHGLATAPAISPIDDNGGYLLEGLRFHMPGQWRMVFTVAQAGSMETIVLEFQL